jgi:predicted AlkP superfamily pyrophosphatase or phosphodiesterase
VAGAGVREKLIGGGLASTGLVAIAALIVAMLVQSSCGVISKTVATGGEVPLKAVPPPKIPHLRVIVFALDGTPRDQFMALVRSGKAPNIARLLGDEEDKNGLFQHGYADLDALSMLPSSTVADWSAILTGEPPGRNGVTGDEWFQRENAKFFAPVPISVTDTGDLQKAITDGLIGDELRVPTLYQQPGVDSNVSLLWIYRGATLYTTVGPSSFTGLIASALAGKLNGDDAEKSISGAMDLDSVTKLTAALEAHGIPNLQVVYFPGIDSFTHLSPNPLPSQLGYLETVTDKGVGEVLDEYRKLGALDDTYVMFVADHGQTPTLNDDNHALGADGDNTPFTVVHDAGFRVRKAKLTLADNEQDYQAVLAYQGFMAYVYLADRSTCRAEGARCDWKKPPRFEKDVMPVVRAFYKVNRSGRPIPRLKGTVDLVFARAPVPARGNPLPFQIFDGHRLVSISDYLLAHPRPDLLDLEQRMDWLGTGPYGNHAGDIVLMSKSGAMPINNRYYFAAEPHYTWHGSADETDSRIPLVLAQIGGSGERMRKIVQANVGKPPSEKDLPAIVRAIIRNHSDDD